MKKTIILIILISTFMISCSKTTRIAENENWYLEETTNMFGKPTEYLIMAISPGYSVNNIMLGLSFSEEMSSILFSGLWEGRVDELIIIHFYDGVTFNFKTKIGYSPCWFDNTEEYQLLLENFQKHNCFWIQGIGSGNPISFNLRGFNEIYQQYELLAIMNKFQ